MLETLNVARFEVLFDELKDKLVNKRPINNRKGLLHVLSETATVVLLFSVALAWRFVNMK